MYFPSSVGLSARSSSLKPLHLISGQCGREKCGKLRKVANTGTKITLTAVRR